MAFDFKALSKIDQGLLATGAVTVLLTFFPAYAKATVEAKGTGPLGSFGGSEDRSAWVEWATLGALLLIAAFVIVVLKLVAGNLPEGAPWNLIVAAAAGLGTLILVLYVFTFGEDVPASVAKSIDYSTGPGWSGWLLLLSAIAFTVFAFLSFKESGEKIPEINKKDTPPPAPPAA
ncbi:hypothetical protein [Aeromicrobium ginsengisoli]|uniref:Uncharacterized protein n=1 Tax=Aeromicrobium ginsengisoli TaxID=363867 RepID=A0A5M4FG07_9ACTN|nr:hypothetical protein [Aeromicrobium ginsengisoli]KAA1398225.1 hypothetical protein ESP70_012940 [Aeromicrobium ginsengisoli]